MNSYKIKNNIDKFYSIFINLMEELRECSSKDEFMHARSKVDYLITRYSNKNIDGSGIVDHKNTIKIINKCYTLSVYYNFYKLTKLIINYMIGFSQSLRMLSMMNIGNNEINFWEIIANLEDDLYLICYAYGTSRDSNYKWKNITTQIIRIDQEEDFLNIKGKNYRRSAFRIAQYIWDNDNLDPYFKVSPEECQKYIIWLLRKGPEAGFETTKFNSAMMVLVEKMVAKYFDFKEKRIFHITSISNLDKIIENNEIWVKKRKYLNDKKEQRSFNKIIKHENILSDDFNYSYISFSMTTSKVPKDTIYRYSSGYKRAVVFEFDKFNSQNLLFNLMIKEGSNGNAHFFGSGSLMGRVIYSEFEMEKIWNKVEKFLDNINKEFGKMLWRSARIKAANVCKMFYKDKKWKNEMEVRIVAIKHPNSINVSENKEFYSFKPGILKSFNKIYASENNMTKIKNKLKNDRLVVESFKIANQFIHVNHSEDRVDDIDSIFLDIHEFK